MPARPEYRDGAPFKKGEAAFSQACPAFRLFQVQKASDVRPEPLSGPV